ncbi:hypothetical protein LZ31DRAFT_326845 [Colletotrichum somersetense]|nr:hypothetical protein LZ31DRAFT_326845 [Colletotrichum somersetense]
MEAEVLAGGLLGLKGHGRWNVDRSRLRMRSDLVVVVNDGINIFVFRTMGKRPSPSVPCSYVAVFRRRQEPLAITDADPDGNKDEASRCMARDMGDHDREFRFASWRQTRPLRFPARDQSRSRDCSSSSSSSSSRSSRGGVFISCSGSCPVEMKSQIRHGHVSPAIRARHPPSEVGAGVT